ncbi:hypothetical protein [Stutzerimonas stutzeri]|uniref:hypothetical protein n=1 Tax=Stutzerimonas stutzeri TaxID=316 RepID=UPI001BCA8064|nr:hypothetical protein [Stutzerimonas stutzeri]
MSQRKQATDFAPQVSLPLADMFDTYLLPDDTAGDYSNLVAVYDVIPRFFTWNKTVRPLKPGIEGSDPETRSELIERLADNQTTLEGEIKGSKFEVVITAATITKKAKSGSTKHEPDSVMTGADKSSLTKLEIYPGLREELVEDALRKFSVSGYGIVDGSQLRVRFTLRDLMLELKSLGHTFSCTEIKEALDILNRAHLSIKIESGNEMIEESSTYLPHLRFAHKRKVVDGEDVCIAQLHPLIVRAIRGGTFRLYGYRKSMELSSSLARIVHKHLSMYWVNASAAHPYSVNLLETLRTTSRGVVARMNDNTRLMEKALEELIESRVLTHFDKRVIRVPKSKAIADVVYTVFPTNEYVGTIIKSHQNLKRVSAKTQRHALLNRGGRGQRA